MYVLDIFITNCQANEKDMNIILSIPDLNI